MWNHLEIESWSLALSSGLVKEEEDRVQVGCVHKPFSGSILSRAQECVWAMWQREVVAEAYRSELEGNRLITETIPNLEPEINTQVEGSVEDLTPESANV